MITEDQLNKWRDNSTTDDHLNTYVLSDIRQMLGEIERLRIRESSLMHWLSQAQVKAENAKKKAMAARDNANHAIDYALDAELCANRALSAAQGTKP